MCVCACLCVGVCELSRFPSSTWLGAPLAEASFCCMLHRLGSFCSFCTDLGCFAALCIDFGCFAAFCTDLGRFAAFCTDLGSFATFLQMQRQRRAICVATPCRHVGALHTKFPSRRQWQRERRGEGPYAFCTGTKPFLTSPSPPLHYTPRRHCSPRTLVGPTYAASTALPGAHLDSGRPLPRRPFRALRPPPRAEP